ncbi:uncharacterized protein LOC107273731 [Cephus cinctus]|uniref:Uncharacterized protein LOC107273728 isoform X1 n=1 Tax=Cephus cinctus TaxID=211228 RepID=A0AAJ7CDQ8_CEPCN|nr:uncharacterized protein LOC107273728 isoform X2 [Cephus cinctus]XP_015607707.1 uncharacterized protein LOC107273728 isoform X1 [Cephus cinctus]XP_015607710.1 uncharacterized protein LOC107273731 [Cephus cinctus]
MKTVIILAALIALCSAVKWTDLRARWNGMKTTPEDSFFQIPRTASSAIAEGWVRVEGVNDHPVDVFCLENDGRFCIITDSFGNIAGFEFGIPASDIENKGIPYDPSIVPNYKKKTLFGEAYWTVTVYSVDPDVIDAGGRSETRGLTGTTGIWIEEGDSYMVVSRHERTMRKELDYHKTKCIPQMGDHYYYAMNETLACSEFRPIVLLYDGGDLLGVAFQGFGPKSSTKRVWWEPILPSFTRVIAPNSPDCLVDITAKYNSISLHIYFVDEPWNISCDNWLVHTVKKIVHTIF